MRIKGIALCLLLLLAACRPATATPVGRSTAPPSETPSYTSADCLPGDHSKELTSGSEVRQYILHVPAAYRPEKSMALILGFHGAGSSAREFESYSDFSFLANVAGFVVVYPQALGEHPTWNTTPEPNNPDIQFVRDLIEEMQHRCNIDPNRIYATGHSNGGGLANRLACDLSERIAAIGSVSGAYQWSEECSPTRPVAVLGIHGSDDPIIPYTGYPDAKEPPAAYYAINVPIPQWAASWARRNDCDTQSVSAVQSDEVQWNNCRGDADVVLYTIKGGGHEWTDTIELAQVIWEFFAEHSR